MTHEEADSFELDLHVPGLETYLRARDWIEHGDRVSSAELAGAGNMNQTVRVRIEGHSSPSASPDSSPRSLRRSFVLKQSRPYVLKFPEIVAPIERIETEMAFYDVASRTPALAKRLPRVLAFDRKNHLAMIEDLGEASDLTSLYPTSDHTGERLSSEDLEVLCGFARDLHCLELPAEFETVLRNDAMRALNRAHLFEVPLDPNNGIDLDALTPGLGRLARSLQADDNYVAKIIALDALYTNAEGPSLLHGDYYPGSFLRTERGLTIIDPEFAFSGPAEFDLGVLVAHLIFSGAGEDIVDRVGAAYARPVDRPLLVGFAGTEIMRRLIGVAQLPLEATLDRKRDWLALSRRWVVGAN